MFNIFQYTQKLSFENKPETNRSDKSEVFSRNASRRLEEWRFNNRGIIGDLYGNVSNKKQPSKKPSSSKISNNKDYEENPYFETKFVENLRKTEKSKHLGNDFIKVNYNNEKERICYSVSMNKSIDPTPSQTPEPLLRDAFKHKIIQKNIISDSKFSYDSSPYCNQDYSSNIRARVKSLELKKNFFVSAKIPTPKANLLISKKYEDFYAKLNGKKIYKNSLEELFKSSP